MKSNITLPLCLGGFRTQVISFAIIATSVTHGAIIFDDFNINEGHFNLAPTFSGSSDNVADNSTADRETILNAPLEGAYQRLVLNWEDKPEMPDPGVNIRVRHLSGSGSAGNNVSFATTSGEDGWIGFYVRSSAEGWTVQLYIEGTENHGGVPKAVIADGFWHLYEWNLDDQTGGPNGWGAIAGIIGGDSTVDNGVYTIDSIIFRDSTTPSSAFDLDFVAKSDSGSIAGLLIPEPSSALLLAGALTTFGFRRQRR